MNALQKITAFVVTFILRKSKLFFVDYLKHQISFSPVAGTEIFQKPAIDKYISSSIIEILADVSFKRILESNCIVPRS